MVLLSKWFSSSFFSVRVSKNRNIHALSMYIPTRMCASVGVFEWLLNIIWFPHSQAPFGWHLWVSLKESVSDRTQEPRGVAMELGEEDSVSVCEVA
jgi:hypothetical protein